MIGRSLSFSCLKKKGLAYGDFEGWIHPEANCLSTQWFISTISCCVSEYSLEVMCPGSILNSILISKSGQEQGSSSHFASLKTDGIRLSLTLSQLNVRSNDDDTNIRGKEYK